MTRKEKELIEQYIKRLKRASEELDDISKDLFRECGHLLGSDEVSEFIDRSLYEAWSSVNGVYRELESISE